MQVKRSDHELMEMQLVCEPTRTSMISQQPVDNESMHSPTELWQKQAHDLRPSRHLRDEEVQMRIQADIFES
jgi:hypothetical protein